MLYPIIEYQHALLKPLAMWAAGATRAFGDPRGPFASGPGARCFAAGCELLQRFSMPYETPGFAIRAIEQDGQTIPVVEQTVLEKPFCRLLRFTPDAAPTGPVALRAQGRPEVMVCAPLAGHHAVLLRETVETLLPEHDVYITDWCDARNVPVDRGPFHLDDYVAYVQEFIRHIGAADLHVLAVCQATVPALAAVSLLASANEPTPRTLILMGGPLDARYSPTAVNLFAASRPLQWFQDVLIHTVPDDYPGAGRRVYPGFLQQLGLLAMHPQRHADLHQAWCLDMVRGDTEGARAHQRACHEYGAMLDMAAEYFLETIQAVFHEYRLARGNLCVRGQQVRPQDIRATALLTVEGELDDVSGCGQTRAAQDLCTGLAASDRFHLTVRQGGHYDLFSGSHWRAEVYPVARNIIRHYDGRNRSPHPRRRRAESS
jgi:poly(3-hydroxybutyrate) depolymerase